MVPSNIRPIKADEKCLPRILILLNIKIMADEGLKFVNVGATTGKFQLIWEGKPDGTSLDRINSMAPTFLRKLPLNGRLKI